MSEIWLLKLCRRRRSKGLCLSRCGIYGLRGITFGRKADGDLPNSLQGLSDVMPMRWKLQNHQRKIDQQKNVRWVRPPDGVLKLNCDASFFQEEGWGGWGFIIRDSDGDVVLSGWGRVNHLLNALQADRGDSLLAGSASCQ